MYAASCSLIWLWRFHRDDRIAVDMLPAFIRRVRFLRCRVSHLRGTTKSTSAVSSLFLARRQRRAFNSVARRVRSFFSFFETVLGWEGVNGSLRVSYLLGTNFEFILQTFTFELCFGGCLAVVLVCCSGFVMTWNFCGSKRFLTCAG